MHLLTMVASPIRSELMFVPAVSAVQPWRFLTSAFLHASFMHIALNMLALWVVGQGLEPVLGRMRFFALFMLSALGGSVGVLVLASPYALDWYIGAVGASGAIFGMLGAVFVLNKKANADMRAISILIAVNLAFGFITPGISWQAHLGGLIVGAFTAWGFIVSVQRRWKHGALIWGLCVGVFLVLVAIGKYALI